MNTIMIELTRKQAEMLEYALLQMDEVRAQSSVDRFAKSGDQDGLDETLDYTISDLRKRFTSD